MTETARDAIALHLRRSSEALARAAGDAGLQKAVADIAALVTKVLGSGGKLLLAGNGGSAADAQHLAAEFLSRFRSDRHPLPALALTTDTSVLTAIGNDYGFEAVFDALAAGTFLYVATVDIVHDAFGKTADRWLKLSLAGGGFAVMAVLAIWA